MPRSARSVVEIEAPIETVYGYWETLENLPDFMTGVEEVRRARPDSTVWRVKGSFGRTLEWKARTILKEPYRCIEWIPAEGDAGISGEVRFEEAGPGRTRIEARLDYVDPPDGRARGTLSRVLDKPDLRLDQDLETLKNHLEGRTTPAEDRERPTVVGVQSRVLGFAAPGALVLATSTLILLYRRRRQSRERKATQTFKFDRTFWKLVLEAIITSR